MDHADRAQEQQERVEAAALAQYANSKALGQRKPSRTHCIECGEEIPEARRRLVLGTDHCIQCAEFIENRVGK